MVTETSGNPTFLMLDDDSFCFCLSFSNVPISCEGATNNIHFPGIEGYWNFYLDDILLEDMVRSDVTGLLNTLGFMYPGKFNGDTDGYFWMQNTDEHPHRFKFVPLHDVEPPNSYTPPTDNPTFTEHEDGSLTFCLAPA